MTGRDAEHPCDGVWLDLDAVLGVAGDVQLDVDALEAAEVVGLVGSPPTLARATGRGALGTLATETPHSGEAPDLVLVTSLETADLARAGRWAEVHQGQLVLDARVLDGLGGDPRGGPWSERAVAGLRVHDAHADALELVRADEALAGFHGTLEFASAYRGGAGSLAGPLPLLAPGWMATLLERCERRGGEAVDAERRLARWIETAVLPAARVFGANRDQLPALLAEIGGWLDVERPLLGEEVHRLRDGLAYLGEDLGLPPDPLDCL